MKLQSKLFLGLAVTGILLSACGKKDTSTGTTSTTGSSSGSTCYLTRQDAGKSYILITYNGDNKPTDISLYDSAGNKGYINQLDYAGPNGALSRISILTGSGVLQEYRYLNYNSNGTVASVDHYRDTVSGGSGAKVKAETVYYAYTNSHISRENLFRNSPGNPHLVGYYTFSYDAKGNNTSMLGFTPSGTEILDYEYTFDNNKAPRGLEYQQYVEVGNMSSVNNPLTIKATGYISFSNSYSYTYTSQGYPAVVTGNVNGSTTRITNTYNCK